MTVSFNSGSRNVAAKMRMTVALIAKSKRYQLTSLKFRLLEPFLFLD